MTDRLFSRTGCATNANSQEVEASGNVRIEQGRDLLEGDRLRFNLGTQRGFIEKPDVSDHARAARFGAAAASAVAVGSAAGRRRCRDAAAPSALLFQGPDLYRAEQASYTTCGPGNDDWFIRARELDIDKNRDVGSRTGASLVLLG